MVTQISDANKQNLLVTALRSEYGLEDTSPIPKHLAVEEVFPERIIYNVDGELYEATYEIDGDTASFGDPKKVTSTKIYRTREAMSFENRRNLLSSALHEHLNLGTDRFVWVEDLNETEVFYNHEGKTFKTTYTITEDGAVTLGESQEVTRQITYKVLEALQDRYVEVIQEVGKRNALRDSARVKQILSLCRELLSSEMEPDEEKMKEAMAEAMSVLAWMKLQEATKTEDGIEFPKAAYAYAPDADTPSGWKLRLWESLEKKVTRAQLGRAAAAFSPGGFRGQKVSIPTAEVASVKRKIRSEYHKLDVEDEDIPRWVREVHTRELVQNFINLKEATIDKGRAKVIVIKPGFNVTEDRYYPAEMLKRDFKVFEGQKMYADHPTEEEDQARPERSIKDWVATLRDVEVDESGIVTGFAEIIEPWMMTKLASLRDKDMLSEMGISINAIGSATKDNIDGKDTLVIEKLVGCRSVDFVTEPGAGGEVTLYESDRQHDVDLVDLSGLRERRPDLVKSIESAIWAEIQQEGPSKMTMEARVKELETTNETLTTERDGLKTQVEEATQEKVKAEAQAAIKEAVDKADLPQAARDRLIAMHTDDVSAKDIEEAIQAEVSYIASLKESGVIKGMGESHQTSEEGQQALKESFARMGLDEKGAELAAHGR